jgi:hypothetical protein
VSPSHGGTIEVYLDGTMDMFYAIPNLRWADSSVARLKFGVSKIDPE